MSTTPLAVRLRPSTLDEVVGQTHLLGEKGILRKLGKNMTNLIFYGPPGVGKTTVSRILAAEAGMTLHHLNGTTASTKDIKEVLSQIDTFAGMNGILLYLDEIQYLNKRQQQTLLECIEEGSITLIASTTENPYFYVYGAILSRCTVLEFKPLTSTELLPAVKRAFTVANGDVLPPLEEGVCEYVASAAGGDLRRAYNAVDVLCKAEDFTLDGAKLVTSRSAMRYDRDGDAHYDILSAYHKSMRGSDENAALHYLARLLEAGDIISPSRRLLACACEDVGLAYPTAISIVKSCVDTAFSLGLPEAQLPLAQATILLCTSPKSSSVVSAISAAMTDVKEGHGGDIPAHLKDAHYSGAAKLSHGIGYKYPHDYPRGWVPQQYLPDEISERVYYRFGENKQEQSARNYRTAQRGDE